MSAFSGLFGSRAGEPPNLATWLAAEHAEPALVVDATAVGVRSPVLPDARSILQAEGGPGLPYSDRDARRLSFPDGAFGAVVLADVLSAVLDVGPAIDEARRVLRPRGVLLVVQTVASDDPEERALVNALARLADPTRTWTPSAKQLGAMLSGFRLATLQEAEWEERAETTSAAPTGALSLLIESVRASGGRGVVRDGTLVLRRRAVLLRGE